MLEVQDADPTTEGMQIQLANPFQQCRVLNGGKELLSTKDATIRLPTQKGDVLEFVESQVRNAQRIE